MANTKHTHFPVGSFVEDMSGTIGEVIGFGEFAATVRVQFNGTWRDLDPNKLKVAKYSPAQLDKIRAAAPELLEALQLADRLITGWIPTDGKDAMTIKNAIAKATL